MTVARPARQSAAWCLRRALALHAVAAASCVAVACAHGGGEDRAPGDDGGATGQDSSTAPEAPSETSTPDSAARDALPGEAAIDVGAADDAGDDATSDAGGFDSAGEQDSQAPVDSAMDSAPPDTWQPPGMDSGKDGGTDAGRDTGTDAPNLPACVHPYDQSDCLSYVAGMTEVSSNSHNWLCSGACANCANHSECAPGQSGCPWAPAWTDEGACH
jgi:hypothetical protein